VVHTEALPFTTHNSRPALGLLPRPIQEETVLAGRGKVTGTVEPVPRTMGGEMVLGSQSAMAPGEVHVLFPYLLH
jgi:hypothetical protein